MDLSLLAILHELNDREFKRKLALYPAELRFYVILAGGIVGLENSRRTDGTPEAVIRDAEGFVAKLLVMIDPQRDTAFKIVLEAYFLEMIRDELRKSCANCRNFGKCLDVENLRVGEPFLRRINGEESEELKIEIRLQVGEALKKTPHVESDEAHRHCTQFAHQYTPSNIGRLFGRYTEIATALGESFGTDTRRLLNEMVSLNLSFCEQAPLPQGRTV
jgi:hypothetical protein